ncbi:type I secretion protein [Jannaschia marina]|uniref:type I secretion protein n=1 Tax=Jannaschia marina TaxID=2741674 RepID=UPI0015C75D74|nr:type I secretion protein [Jannaschia marina]
MRAVPLPVLEDDVIATDLFGGNFLADRYVLGRDGNIEAAVDRLGVSGLRYPGGSLTERLFDITDPNAPRVEEDDGSVVDFVPLNDFLAYAEAADQSVTIVLPTRDFLSARTDGNGDRFPDFDAEALRGFVRDVATGVHGDARIDAFEIGNEYWGSGEMTAVEYGRLSSRMTEVIDDELDRLGAETGEPSEIDILVQSGTNFGFSDLAAGYAGKDAEAVLADLNARYGTEFGEEVVFPQGALNWRRINDELLQREFDAGELDAVDGVVTHLYSKDPVQPGQREFGLDTIQKVWIDDAPHLDIHVTEWNQSAAEPRFDSDGDYGLRQAHEVLDTFETMVAAGVDQAHVWPLLQNTRNALQPDGLEGEVSPSGALFAMMSDALPGKQMLDFEVRDDDVTEFQGRTADLHGFYGKGELVFYLASTSERTETLSLDLGQMVRGGGTVSGQLLGVRDGDAPGATDARAEVETLHPGTFYDDGHVAVALDPGEILEIRIAGFKPTPGFREVMEGLDTTPDAPPVPPEDIPPMLDPIMPSPDRDEPEAEDTDSDDFDDDMPDAIAWLLGLLPLLALAGAGLGG